MTWDTEDIPEGLLPIVSESVNNYSCCSQAVIAHVFSTLRNYYTWIPHTQQSDKPHVAKLLRRIRFHARERIISLQHTDLEYEDIFNTISLEDREVFYRTMKGNRRDAIQGLIGELVGLVVGNMIKNEYVDLVSGQPRTSIDLEMPPLRITFRNWGSTVYIEDKSTSRSTEIDHLATYQGIPIIIECKTGVYASQKSVLHHTAMVQQLYGVKPLYLEVRSGHHRGFQKIHSNHYILSLPFRQNIITTSWELVCGLDSLL